MSAFLAAGNLPQANARPTPDSQGATVRGEGQSEDVPLVPSELVQLLRRGDFPNDRQALLVARCQVSAIGREREGVNHILGKGKLAKFLAGCGIEQSDGGHSEGTRG